MDRSDAVRALATEHRARRGPLLPILHAVIEAYGWVDDADIDVIADVLNLSRAEVFGVVSFYEDFRTTPPPAFTVRVCRGEACQSVGADALHRDLAAELGDGRVEVGEVFCLGNCALGPSAQVNNRLVARATPQRVRALVAQERR